MAGFDAGSITGSLTLDLEGFLASLGSAEGSANQFDQVVQQSLVGAAAQASAAINQAAQSAAVSFEAIANAAESTVSPIDDASQASTRLGDSLSSLTGPADNAAGSADHVGFSLSSLTSSQQGASQSAEGLSASMGEGAAAGGPYAAEILAVVEVAKAAISILKELGDVVRDMTVDVGNAEAELSLAAEKAGVPIEKFSELATVAKVVGVSSNELGSAFKFLQKNAVDAVEGDDKLTQSFKDVGVSVEFLKDHINDANAIFQAVQSGMGGLGSNAERAKEAMQLLGREGSDLVPLFDMTSESIKRIGEDMKDLGAVDDESTERTARTWKLLSTYIESAWEGIKKAVAEPILNYLADHIDEIIPKIIQFSHYIREGIGEAFVIVRPIAMGFWHIIEALGVAVEKVAIPAFNNLAPTLETLGNIIGALLDKIAAFIAGVTEGIRQVEHLGEAVKAITGVAAAEALISKIGEVTGLTTKQVGAAIGEPPEKQAPAGGYSSLVDPPINVNVNTTINSEKKESHKGVGKKVQDALDHAVRQHHQDKVARGMGARR